jgi:hypothetical protein
MKRSRLTEEQIRHGDIGGVSQPWDQRGDFLQMEGQVRAATMCPTWRLKALEENAKLKKLLAGDARQCHPERCCSKNGDARR